MSPDENPATDPAAEEIKHELTEAVGQPQAESADRHEQRASEPPLPTKQTLIRRLDHLALLVLTDVVPTARANTAHGIYRTLLGELGSTESARNGQLSDGDVLKMFRGNPELVELYRGVLTKHQLDLLMKEYQDPTES